MLKINAVMKESTLKPPTILAHKSIKTALITNKNNPKVNKVTGIVRNTNMGFKNVFNNPNTMATHKAATIEVTCTPGKK
jgi:hypothetical protein